MKKLFLFFLFLNTFLFLKAQNDTTLTVDQIMNMTIEEMLQVPITGASIYHQNLSTVPGNVLIINSEDIINRGYSDLSDVLKDAFGFDIVDNARGFGEYYRIQGIEGNDRFLVLIDGHKINPSTGTFLSVGNSISVRYAKRIEIIYGPVSVIYGSEALSGVINIVTNDKKGCKDLYGHTRLSYGNANTFDEEIGVNYSNKKGFKFGVYGRIFNSNGPDLINRDTVYNIITNYTTPQTPNFEQPINDHTVLINASYKQFHAKYFRQYFNEGNALGTHPKGNIYNKEYKWASVNQHLIFGYHNRFKNSNELKLDISFTHFKIDPETQFYKWKNSYSTDTSFSQYMTGDDKSIRLNASFDRKFGENGIFLVGMESEYINSIPPYANDQVLGSSIKFEGENAELIKQELSNVEFRTAGFMQISYQFFNKLTPIVGIRYSYSDVHDPAFTPRMGIVFSLFKGFNFKYIYGVGFQAPSMFYKYEQWGAASAVMLSEHEVKEIEPAWALKNQRVETHDFSFNWKIGEKLLISASTFSHQLKDLIERSTFSDAVYNKYFSNSDVDVYSTGIRNENIGSQYTYGMNLNLNFNLNYNISTYFSYSFIDGFSKVNEIETDIAGIANHKFWMGLNFHNLIKNLNVSLRYKQVGAINNRNLEKYTSGKQPGFSNLDVYIDYRYILDRFTIFMDIDNVLNQDYQHPGLYQQSGGYLPEIHQNLRTIKFGLEILF